LCEGAAFSSVVASAADMLWDMKFVWALTWLACEAGRQAAYKSGSTSIGTVALSLIVDSKGRAENVMVVRPLGFGLDDQAVKAIRTWRFKPAMKDDTPVPVYATIEVNFNLPGKCFPSRKSGEASK
jgi:TonB family protein